ncbi:MAG: hypothetical protein ABII71_04535 [Candidatus Micrarchaeota archaeon]
MNSKKFNPLIFLMPLGAGGIAIIPFAFFQYTYEHGPGLVQLSQIDHGALSLVNEALFMSLEGIMLLFAAIHIILTLVLIKDLLGWKREDYKALLNDPLRNATIVAPFISIIMTMNVFIGPVRFFIPLFAENLQALMAPALLAWGLIWLLLIKTDIRLLKIAFEKSFDVSKVSFGWLLHPFALGMLTVTGTGIAAMAKDPAIAHTAAFMSLVSGTMGLFLLAVKLIAIFKSHFASKGMPAKQFLPSFLIVVPNITLYAISAFRLGHYVENQFGEHLGIYFMAVMTVAFAFESWYLLFGMSLLKDYFRNYFFRKEFYVTQWGLVCPVVAFAVLGSFVFSVFVPSPIIYAAILTALVVAIVLFFILLGRQLQCNGIVRETIDCS